MKSTQKELVEKVAGLTLPREGKEGKPFYGTGAARSYARAHNQALNEAIEIIRPLN